MSLNVISRLRPEPGSSLSRADRIERGRRAEELIADGSLFREIWDEVQVQILETWRDATDPEVRERAHAVFSGLGEVQRVLHAVIEDAAVAAQVPSDGLEDPS